MTDSLTAAQIVDLQTTTLADLGRSKFSQIAQSITDLPVMRVMLKKDKTEYQNGKSIDGNLLVNHNFSAKMVGLHETYDVNIPDVMKTFSVPWKHTTWNWGYERRELKMNEGASRIVDLMETRRIAGLLSAAELMEEQFWNEPTDVNDDNDLWGLPYWVVKNAATGFNGGIPAGFTDVAGLDPTVYPNWKNFTGTFTDFTADSVGRLLRKMHRKTNFRSPVSIDDYSKGNGDKYRIQMNEETIDSLEDAARRNNDSLGNDLAQFMDATAFKKHPLVYTPKLDEDTSNPIYFANFANITIAVLEGDAMHEHDPMNSQEKPNTWVTHVDLSWNLVCTDRRRQGVIYQVAS